MSKIGSANATYRHKPDPLSLHLWSMSLRTSHRAPSVAAKLRLMAHFVALAALDPCKISIR